MPKKVTAEQRDEVLRMLTQGHDRDTIAVAVGGTPGQVSAIADLGSIPGENLPPPLAG
jgi:hypothetical protein